MKRNYGRVFSPKKILKVKFFFDHLKKESLSQGNALLSAEVRLQFCDTRLSQFLHQMSRSYVFQKGFSEILQIHFWTTCENGDCGDKLICEAVLTATKTPYWAVKNMMVNIEMSERLLGDGWCCNEVGTRVYGMLDREGKLFCYSLPTYPFISWGLGVLLMPSIVLLSSCTKVILWKTFLNFELILDLQNEVHTFKWVS